MPPESRHNTVGRARVLHLDHCPLARNIVAGRQLRDHAVQPGAFEASQPVECSRAVARNRRDMQRRFHFTEQLLESFAASRLRLSPDSRAPSAPATMILTFIALSPSNRVV